MSAIAAELLARAWRRVDVKLSVDGRMHVLRWRRTMFHDAVYFDDRRIAVSKGWSGRETTFGLEATREGGEPLRLLFIVDPEPDWADWSGTMRPRGVRLESAERPLLAVGTLGADRGEPFRKLFDDAVKALGLG